MKFEDFKQELLKDPDFKKEYFKRDLGLEIAEMFIDARILKGITQEQLASLSGTKQPSIARIESGNYLPGLRFLEKVAKALDTYLISPRFAFLEKDLDCSYNHISEIKTTEKSDVVFEAERLINQSSALDKITNENM